MSPKSGNGSGGYLFGMEIVDTQSSRDHSKNTRLSKLQLQPEKVFVRQILASKSCEENKMAPGKYMSENKITTVIAQEGRI